MADYRGRSRRSESSSGSSSSGGSAQYYQTTSRSSGRHSITFALTKITGNSNFSYPAVASGEHSYYTAAVNQQPSSQTSYGHYTISSLPFEVSASTSSYGHPHYSDAVPRHSTYPDSVASTASPERASKRRRAATTHDQGHMPAQWTDMAAQVYPPTASRQTARGHPSPHGSRGSRDSEWDGSVSSGYSSPTYSHGTYHDPYGQQLWQPPSSVPGVGASSIRDPQLYGMRCSSHPFSDDDEHVDHGPTELPPRTYSGKSQYDPPKKPGKIPGSAMDYVRDSF